LATTSQRRTRSAPPDREGGEDGERPIVRPQGRFRLVVG
jgi:hypothetical protein